MKNSIKVAAMDRRDFMKGAAVAAVGTAALAGLTGCGSPQKSESAVSSSSTDNGAVAPGVTVGGSICGED